VVGGGFAKGSVESWDETLVGDLGVYVSRCVSVAFWEFLELDMFLICEKSIELSKARFFGLDVNVDVGLAESKHTFKAM
jgi:hypothetical protein